MKMKFVTLFAMLFLLWSLGTSAQTLVLHLSDGTTFDAELSSNFRMYNIGDKTIISFADGNTKEFMQSDILAYSYRETRGDVNRDNTVDIADIATIINIMSGGQELVLQDNVNCNDTSQESALQRLEFPHIKEGNVVLIHTTNDQYGINYSVEWDPQKKAQRWSCYQLDKRTLQVNTSRYSSQDNQYPHDPLLPDNLYLSQDCFWNSGYDHGHICPSADRLYSLEANYQTFFLTNMQPQYRAFNGSLSGSDNSKNDWSPWYRLESQVRSWANAQATETLYVVKGGTIEDNQIFPNKLKGEMIIPKYFFVALLLKNAQGYKAVGFWMEHKDSYDQKLPLGDYAVNIEELQHLTGIDFFCNLPDDVEQRVEKLPLENVKRAWGL